MSQPKDTPAMRALKRKVEELINPAKVEFHKIGSQTSFTNGNLLYRWSKEMRYHEHKTPCSQERVYLVASDLKLILASRQKVQKIWDETSKGIRSPHVFLDSKEIDDLHEKHWAIEIDGRYFELVRDEDNCSYFSARNRVGHFDRRVTTRIFIGTTHFECNALKSIELPFGVEEHMASRAAEKNKYGHHYLRTVSQNVGAGVEWTTHIEGLQVEFRRTVRDLKQNTTTKSEYGGTEYFDKFTSKQEQTCYISELHPQFLAQLQACQPVTENPYIRLLRFEKVTHLLIIPRTRHTGYKISTILHGMISGPYGSNQLSKGIFQLTQPVEIIRDESRILRDGDGNRLEWPVTTWRYILADIQDTIFIPPTRRSYAHKTDINLLKSAGPLKQYPFLVSAIKQAPVIAGVIIFWYLRKKYEAQDWKKNTRNETSEEE